MMGIVESKVFNAVCDHVKSLPSPTLYFLVALIGKELMEREESRGVKK